MPATRLGLGSHKYKRPTHNAPSFRDISFSQYYHRTKITSLPAKPRLLTSHFPLSFLLPPLAIPNANTNALLPSYFSPPPLHPLSFHHKAQTLEIRFVYIHTPPRCGVVRCEEYAHSRRGKEGGRVRSSSIVCKYSYYPISYSRPTLEMSEEAAGGRRRAGKGGERVITVCVCVCVL